MEKLGQGLSGSFFSRDLGDLSANEGEFMGGLVLLSL